MDKMLDLTQPTPTKLIEQRNGFDISIALPKFTPVFEVTKPLEDPTILLTGGCHVDHEGYDLNEIEQAFYRNEGISLVKDPTWYKDGGGERVTTAILQPWIDQLNEIMFGEDQLILDHSHFVYKFPIRGEAEQQVRQYAKQRPELLRLVSTNYKCGLDVCIDLLDGDENGSIQPIVHIEWDYDDFEDMYRDAIIISNTLKFKTWQDHIPTIKRYNQAARKAKEEAFKQANFRSQTIFGDKAYKLIPTL
jgi:hypothetical protein